MVEKKKKSKDDPVICILHRIVWGMKKDKRPITFQSVCEEVERAPHFPTLADKVTTTMIKQILHKYQSA